MEKVKLTFELNQEALTSTAFLMGCQLTDKQLQQLKEKEIIVDSDSEFLKNQELVIGLASIALAMLVNKDGE